DRLASLDLLLVGHHVRRQVHVAGDDPLRLRSVLDAEVDAADAEGAGGVAGDLVGRDRPFAWAPVAEVHAGEDHGPVGDRPHRLADRARDVEPAVAPRAAVALVARPAG